MFDAYVSGSAGALYGTHFARSEDWDAARRVARPLSPGLATALEAQNAAYEASPARDAHLRALREGACAVVTGQQTGLFLGPLFTLYKAASTIRLARWLAERWNAPVVPVFWLQTEDHDAAEIAVCHIARGGDEPLTLALPVAEGAVSVAKRVLPDEVSARLAELAGAVAHLPHGDEHVAMLSRHYRPGTGAASALVERAATLEASGFHAGVHVRPGAPLSFFHPEGAGGPRYRLAKDTDGFVEVGGARRRTLPELLAGLDRDPASFTTSALLRPILQDTWLPTIAYVGGPAEVAYFAQLQPIYAAFDVAMPIVVPRAQLRLLERPTRLALSRRGLTAAEAIRPLDDPVTLTMPVSPEPSDGERLTRRLVAGVDRLLDEAAPEVAAAGERAAKALEKTRRAMSRSAVKLGRSVDRAVSLRDREAVSELEGIRARLFPRGVPQERFFAPASFCARYGQRAFIDRVLAAAEPLRTGFHDVIL